MKRGSVLARKIVIGFLALAVLICVAGTGIGYSQYKQYIYKQYNETAYQIAAVFKNFFDKEELEQYISVAQDYKNGEIDRSIVAKTAQKDRYVELRTQLKHLMSDMEVNDIYLAYLDVDELYNFNGDLENWHPMVYIFDSYYDPSKTYMFGDMGGLNPTFLEDAIKVAETGEKADNYFISESEFGYNTSAILPIVKNGKTIAVIGVEVPMVTLESALNRYLMQTILSMGFVSALSLLFYMMYFFRAVINPINLIAGEVSKFVDNDNKISEALGSIKTNDEIQMLGENIIKMQTDINQYIDNLTIVTAEKERIGAELDVAKEIQASMLPCIFPAFPERNEFDIYATMTPAKEVGGDFYDFFLVDDNHLAMVMADVSGKGVPAALFMMISKTLIKSAAQTGLSPKEILETVNNQLCENNEAEMFVTVWIGILEITTGKMVCANAGHEYPAIKRKNGRFELYKDKHGFVLAGMENVRYREYEIELNKGDAIFVYTDGVPEATNGEQELFGTDRMIDALNRINDDQCTHLLKNVHDEVDAFVAEAPQFDDITMLCLVFGKMED